MGFGLCIFFLFYGVMNNRSKLANHTLGHMVYKINDHLLIDLYLNIVQAIIFISKKRLLQLN